MRKCGCHTLSVTCQACNVCSRCVHVGFSEHTVKTLIARTQHTSLSFSSQEFRSRRSVKFYALCLSFMGDKMISVELGRCFVIRCLIASLPL